MHHLVMLAGEELAPLVAISTAFDRAWAPYFVQADRPVQALLQSPAHDVEAAIVSLSGDENVVDLRALLNAYRDARFVFLAPAFPPHAAVARIVHEYGGTILRRDESPIVVVATLITMLSATAAV